MRSTHSDSTCSTPLFATAQSSSTFSTNTPNLNCGSQSIFFTSRNALGLPYARLRTKRFKIPEFPYGGNCNYKPLGPRWQGVTPMWRSCDNLKSEIAKHGFGYFGNERWLDDDNNGLFCDGFQYTTLLREPESRAISQVRFADRDIEGMSHFIMMNNYLVWSLVAAWHGQSYGDANRNGGSKIVFPEPDWLEEAKNVIVGFDSIMLLHEGECMESWLGEIGFQDVKLPKSNKAKNDLKSQGYDTLLIRKLNALDFELYDLAVELSHIGCEYLKDYQKWKTS